MIDSEEMAEILLAGICCNLKDVCSISEIARSVGEGNRTLYG